MSGDKKPISISDSKDPAIQKSVLNVPNARDIGASLAKTSKEEENMKSSRKVLNLKNSSKGMGQTSEDPRESCDLKQKVRKVRFFLPFSSSLESKHKASVQKRSDRSSNGSLEENQIENTGMLVTQVLKGEKPETTQEKSNTFENKMETIKEDVIGIDNNGQALAVLPVSEDTDNKVTAGELASNSWYCTS